MQSAGCLRGRSPFLMNPQHPAPAASPRRMVPTVMADGDRLEQELRASPPAGLLHVLSSGEVEHLADVVAAARRRQAAAIATAGEHGLRFVPRLLRGPIRKALGG